jgi:hypothetical protein
MPFKICTSVLVIAFMTCGLGYAQSSKSSGVFKIVKGDVRIRSGRDGKIVKAEIGTRVYASDTVLTADQSRAKIEMIDGNELNVLPASQITIKTYEFDPQNNKKNVLLNVLSGKIRSKVNQKYDGQTSHFQVTTPSAVAGVRGTDFITSYDASMRQSSILTFNGKVEFGQPGPNGSILNSVFVKPGQTSSAAANAAPTPPTAVPTSDLKKLDIESKPESGPAAGNPNGASNTGVGSKTQTTAGNSTPEPTAATAAGAVPGSGSRDPASLTDPASSGGLSGPSSPTHSSIFTPDDLAGGSGSLPPPLPTQPQLPNPNLLPNFNNLPKCDVCNQIIQNGNANLQIHVTTSP